MDCAALVVLRACAKVHNDRLTDCHADLFRRAVAVGLQSKPAA